METLEFTIGEFALVAKAMNELGEFLKNTSLPEKFTSEDSIYMLDRYAKALVAETIRARLQKLVMEMAGSEELDHSKVRTFIEGSNNKLTLKLSKLELLILSKLFAEFIVRNKINTDQDFIEGQMKSFSENPNRELHEMIELKNRVGCSLIESILNGAVANMNMDDLA